MTHLDLFSGIGGFALAAQWVGWETIGFCEIDPYASEVLKKHWPTTLKARDYKTSDKAQEKRKSPDLPTLATLQARDYRTGQAARWANPNRSRNLNDQMGGKLSVIFAEWFMGYPIGWTALDALGTQSFRKSRREFLKRLKEQDNG